MCASLVVFHASPSFSRNMISQLLSSSLKRLSPSDQTIRLFGQKNARNLPQSTADNSNQANSTISNDHAEINTQNTSSERPTDYGNPFFSLDMNNDENTASCGAAVHDEDVPSDEEHSRDSSHHYDYESHHGYYLKHSPIQTPSAYALQPIHSAIEYYLSFENLTCLRRSLDKSTTQILRQLSWKDLHESVGGTRYNMASEVFFDMGTFYQRQQIRCLFHGSDKESKPETFTGCPHQSLKISEPSWSSKSGLIKVQLDIKTKYPQRCVYHAKQRWNSLQGRHSHIEACKLCFSDSELKLQMNGPYLEVEYTCYRDLGAGEDANDPKWRSLLGGHQSGICRPEANKLLLYANIWRIADRYGRPLVEESPYKSPDEMSETVINETSDEDVFATDGSGDNEADDDSPGDDDSQDAYYDYMK